MTYGVVAQTVEHLLLRLQEGGDSKPPHPTSYPGSSMVEQPPSNRKVAGSSPVRGTASPHS